MRRNGLKSGLLFSTSLMTAALGYGKKAYAACTPDPFVPNAFLCSGVNAVPGNYTFGGSNVAVVVASPSVFFTFAADDQISITGDGNLFFESQGTVILFSDLGVGVDILNNIANTPGSITVTTAFQAPTGPNNWRIEGDAAAIRAINNANGDINLTLNNRLIGEDAGVIADHNGTGNITITVGNAAVGLRTARLPQLAWVSTTTP